MHPFIEVIDVTDAERYFPLGNFNSIVSANEAINKWVVGSDGGCPPHSEFTDPAVGVVLEFRERQFGWDYPQSEGQRSWDCDTGDDGERVWTETTKKGN